MENVPMILTIHFSIFDINFKNPSFFRRKIFRFLGNRDCRVASLLAMTEGWIAACAGMTEKGVGMTERGTGIQKKSVPHYSGHDASCPYIIMGIIN